MKALSKILSIFILLAYMTTSTYAAVTTVSCDSDAAFSANSCSQCFSGWEAVEGDNKGLLSDDWTNTSSESQVLFKEEQDMPKIISLGGAVWKEIKASDGVDFWQYTSDLEALYDEENLGYSLEAWKSVTWLESTLGSAYNLVTNTAAQGDNIGLITYDIAVHQIESDGDIGLDAVTHRECVLFKSGTPGEPPVTPPELPQTGPEHIFLALVALLLGFGFLQFRKRA